MSLSIWNRGKMSLEIEENSNQIFVFLIHLYIKFGAGILCKIPVLLCFIEEEALVSMFDPTDETTIRRIFQIIRDLQLSPVI